MRRIPLIFLIMALTAHLTVHSPLTLSWALQAPSQDHTAPIPRLPAMGHTLNLGTITHFKPAAGPLLIHLQAAHGNYEVQKKIHAILNLLKDRYGIDLVFVEGSAFELEPGILRFFPGNDELTMKTADALMRRSLVKGVEMFLLENSDAAAYGVENIALYKADLSAFRTLMSHQHEIHVFLDSVREQINELSRKMLNKSLKNFLKSCAADPDRSCRYGEKLQLMEEYARRDLGLDFKDPANQIEWPMMVRFARIQAIEKTLDKKVFSGERQVYLAKAQPWLENSPERLEALEKLLSLEDSPESVAPLENAQKTEETLRYLEPRSPLSQYKELTKTIEKNLLSQELSAGRLIHESDRLKYQLLNHFAKTQKEKKFIKLLRSYELLRKLLDLQLTQWEWVELKARAEPFSTFFEDLRRWAREDASSRMSGNFPRIRSLIKRAAYFYRLAEHRDLWMAASVRRQMQRQDRPAAVIVTGGFHAEGLKKYFAKRDVSYLAISPNGAKSADSEPNERHDYVQSILRGHAQKTNAALEAPFLSDPYQMLYDQDGGWLDHEAASIMQQNLAGDGKEAKAYADAVHSLRGRAERALTLHALKVQRSELRSAPETNDLAKLETQLDVEQIANFEEIGFFIKDLAGRFIFVNPYFASLHNRPIADIIGKKDDDLFPPELAKKNQEDDQWVTTVGKAREDVKEHILPDKTKMFVRTLKSPLKDSAGKIIGVSGIFWDVTSEENRRRLRRTEHAVTKVLSNSATLEEAMPAIMEAISTVLDWEFGLLWRHHADHDLLKSVQFWAPDPRLDGFLKISLGRTFQRGVGLPGRVFATARPAWIPDVTQDSNFPRAPFALEAGLHGAFAFPIIMEQKVLGVMEFFSHEIRKPDEDLLQMMSSIGDQIGQFIQRREAETRLVESEEQFRSIAQSALDAILIVNSAGNIIFWNKAAEKMFGFGSNALKNQRFVTLLGEESRERFEELWGGASNLKEPPRRQGKTEAAGRKKDGLEFPIELAYSYWDTGKGIFYGLILHDISERKMQESRMAEVQSQLLQSEKLASIGQLSAGIAHEVNNPLTVIKGYVEMIGDFIPEEGKKMLETVSSHVDRIAEIVQNLLTFSRPTIKKFSLNDIRIPLRIALQHVQMLPEFKNSRIKVVEDYATHLPRVYSDTTSLSQVFLNLMVNAIHAMGTEGTLTIHTGKDESGRGVEVLIQDTGKGIAPKDIPKIFEPFYTTKRGEEGQAKGTGLGMPIALKIVQTHGGDLGVKSTPGTGTVMKIVFPSEYLISHQALQLQIYLTNRILHDLNNSLLRLSYLEIMKVQAGDEAVNELRRLLAFLAQKELNYAGLKLMGSLGQTPLPSFHEVDFSMTEASRFLEGLSEYVKRMEPLLSGIQVLDSRQVPLLDQAREGLDFSKRLIDFGLHSEVYRVLRSPTESFAVRTEIEAVISRLNALQHFRQHPLKGDVSQIPENLRIDTDSAGFRQALINILFFIAGKTPVMPHRISFSGYSEKDENVLTMRAGTLNLSDQDLETALDKGRDYPRIFDWLDGNPDLSASYEFFRVTGAKLDLRQEDDGLIFMMRFPRKGQAASRPTLMIPAKKPEVNEGLVLDLPALEPEAEKTETSSQAMPLNFTNVLYADDENEIRTVINMYLEMLGIKEIKNAVDGQEAVDQFQSNEDIDLVILDMTMPHKDGIKAAQEMHQLRPNVPIVLLTGYGASLPEIQTAVEKGIIQKVWAKPPSKELMDQDLRHIAAKQAKRSEMRQDALAEKKAKLLLDDPAFKNSSEVFHEAGANWHRPGRDYILTYRGKILPLHYEHAGHRFLYQQLRRFLRPVPAAKASFSRTEKRDRILHFQSELEVFMQSSQDQESGRVLMDVTWLDALIRSPESLLLLLDSLHSSQTKHGLKEPVLAVAASRASIYRRLKTAVEGKTQDGYGDLRPHHLMKRFTQAVKLVALEDIPAFIRNHDHGVVIFRPPDSLLANISATLHFIIHPSDIRAQGVSQSTVIYLIPALLKAASLDRHSAGLHAQTLLEEQINHLFPGAKRQGNTFILSPQHLLEKALLSHRYLATQA